MPGTSRRLPRFTRLSDQGDDDPVTTLGPCSLEIRAINDTEDFDLLAVGPEIGPFSAAGRGERLTAEVQPPLSFPAATPSGEGVGDFTVAGRSGRVKKNVLPCLGSDSTQRRPP